MHYHTAYGFPRWGLHWTEDKHATPKDAWFAVGEIVGENYRLDKDRIHSDLERHGNVKGAYARAAQLCLSGHLPPNTSFDIPALDDDKDSMAYGIVSCDQAHLQVVS